MKEMTTIPLKKSTRDNLKNIGKKGQTFDDLICLLLAGGTK
jgi:hypothetical protein